MIRPPLPVLIVILILIMLPAAQPGPRLRPAPVFHTVENFFPHCGKIGQSFSTPRKNRRKFFHSVENSALPAQAAPDRMGTPAQARPRAFLIAA